MTIRIGASGCRFESRRAASRPFISGIKKSITVTSGALSRHVSTALRPLAASPTTTHSAGCSSTARRWALIRALSSTRKIRIKQVLPCQSMRERTAYKIKLPPRPTTSHTPKTLCRAQSPDGARDHPAGAGRAFPHEFGIVIFEQASWFIVAVALLWQRESQVIGGAIGM